MVKNKLNIIFSAALMAAGTLLWTGCSDDFLKEKTDYSKINPIIYNTKTGALKRVDDIYLRQLPMAGDLSSFGYRSPSSGLQSDDPQMQATEEFTGLGSEYINPDRKPSDGPNIDYFMNEAKTSRNVFGEIRNCNDVIEGIQNGSMPDIDKPELLGQAYFFRAWQYFLTVRNYGGIPIIKTVMATDVGQAGDLAVPRATSKECIDFICEDFERAAEMLPDQWDASNLGRVTKGAALAMAARARLLYASPLFNRRDDEARWQAAYDAFVKAEPALAAGGYGLANANSTEPNAGGFSRMFSEFTGLPEMIFGTLYNMVKNNSENTNSDTWRNSNREGRMRPGNAAGGGGVNATDLMVDLFPMRDGRRPSGYTQMGVAPSAIAYNPNIPFKDRDPRFYRTFAFAGVRWRFEGDPTALEDKTTSMIYKGDDYALWNYSWYADAAKKGNVAVGGMGADMLSTGYKGIYIRKRSNDFDLTPACPRRYYLHPSVADYKGSGNFFGESSMPHMEYRYAEFLLDKAEAACGINNFGEAIGYLVDIRVRAGYDRAVAEASFSDIAGDRGKIFGAIMYERQIELAYEGKRFHDMRRWLLWEGGTELLNVAGAPFSWGLNGAYNNNTCDYLGVQPFNGSRRNTIEFTTIKTAPENSDSDQPFPASLVLTTPRPAPLDLREEIRFSPDGVVGGGENGDALVDFYRNNLQRKTRRGDRITGAGDSPTQAQLDAAKKTPQDVVTFNARYYFIGLKSGAQNNNRTLLQTIGWQDALHGNVNGTYDPIAE